MSHEQAGQSAGGRAAGLRRSCQAIVLAQVARVRLLLTRRVFGRHAARRARAQVAWGLLYIHARYGQCGQEPPGWYGRGRQP